MAVGLDRLVGALNAFTGANSANPHIGRFDYYEKFLPQPYRESQEASLQHNDECALSLWVGGETHAIAFRPFMTGKYGHAAG